MSRGTRDHNGSRGQLKYWVGDDKEFTSEEVEDLPSREKIIKHNSKTNENLSGRPNAKLPGI